MGHKYLHKIDGSTSVLHPPLFFKGGTSVLTCVDTYGHGDYRSFTSITMLAPCKCRAGRMLFSFKQRQSIQTINEMCFAKRRIDMSLWER
jgi:hypothetical protein